MFVNPNKSHDGHKRNLGRPETIFRLHLDLYCHSSSTVPVAGYEFCVMNDDNVSTVITLAALGSSSMYENTARTAYGTAGTGTFVSGGAVGDKVCIVGRDTTHYLTTAFLGTWTAN